MQCDHNVITAYTYFSFTLIQSLSLSVSVVRFSGNAIGIRIKNNAIMRIKHIKPIQKNENNEILSHHNRITMPI